MASRAGSYIREEGTHLMSRNPGSGPGGEADRKELGKKEHT